MPSSPPCYPMHPQPIGKFSKFPILAFSPQNSQSFLHNTKIYLKVQKNLTSNRSPLTAHRSPLNPSTPYSSTPKILFPPKWGVSFFHHLRIFPLPGSDESPPSLSLISEPLSVLPSFSSPPHLSVSSLVFAILLYISRSPLHHSSSVLVIFPSTPFLGRKEKPDFQNSPSHPNKGQVDLGVERGCKKNHPRPL